MEEASRTSPDLRDPFVTHDLRLGVIIGIVDEHQGRMQVGDLNKIIEQPNFPGMYFEDYRTALGTGFETGYLAYRDGGNTIITTLPGKQ